MGHHCVRLKDGAGPKNTGPALLFLRQRLSFAVILAEARIHFSVSLGLGGSEVPDGRMEGIAICGALFALRPPSYIEYAYDQQGSDRIHISSIPSMRPSTASRNCPSPPSMAINFAHFHTLVAFFLPRQ